MDQPGEVANPTRGQLNRDFFPCLRSRLIIWSCETGSADPSSLSPLILHTEAETGVYSRDSPRFLRRWRLHIVPSTAIGSVPSLSGYHAIERRWCSLARVSTDKGPVVLKVARVTGGVFRGVTMNHFYAPLFFHTHYWYLVDMCDTERIRWWMSFYPVIHGRDRDVVSVRWVRENAAFKKYFYLQVVLCSGKNP